MRHTKIFYNPNCSKCRAALEMLKEQGESPDVIEYLKAPPTKEELEQILDLLGIEPRELMRKEEEAFKTNELNRKELTREQLIDAMVKNPILIQRPIVISGGRAVIGRPPEKVLKLFQ